MKQFILYIGFVCFFQIALLAQEHSNVAFIENKNQWDEKIKFKTEFRGGAIFFEKNCITYVLQDRESVEKILDRKFSGELFTEAEDFLLTYHAYKVHFNNTQQNIDYEGTDIYPDYNNYYIGKDPARWASMVRKYHSITYENMYEGIHLNYYEKNHSLKYEFIIEAGSNPAAISMTYEGMDKFFLKKGNLYIRCGKQEVVELRPIAYQKDKSGDYKEIPCEYVIKKNTVTFKIGTYDTSEALIIDPTLTFCSYSGSYADNWGYTATYDSYGNLYGGGSVFGTGYPITTGAYQVNYGSGSNDIGISKYSTNGDSLLFSTYLGGSGSEVPHSLIVNDNNELYVLASTSSLNFAVTPNAFDTSFNGGTPFILTNSIQYLIGVDIAIAKFNAAGTQLLGCTYYGGSGNDGLSTDPRLRKNYADEVRGEIMVDEYSNVYIVSSTASGNLPTSPSAYQKTYGGGRQDGLIAKFNYDLSNLIWASYLGGDSSDVIYSMAFDNAYNVYVCGGTYSRNFPTTSGVIQPTYAGGISDGFIAKLSTNGDQLLHSTYYGRSGFDQTYLIKLDRANAPYVMGLTDASGTSWVQNATWYTTNGGQFISKLSTNLSQVIWSTAFGTGNIGPDISPTALLVDLCKNIYVSGWGSPRVNSNIGNNTGGTSGLPITIDAFQTTTDNNDFYFFSISEDASRLVFATYFGGNISSEHVDGGTSRFDKKGFIYQAICSSCGGHQDLPVTPGVVSQTNNSPNCNLGVVKIDFNLPAVVADFTCPNTICAPLTIFFDNRSQVISASTSTYYWDFGDGTYSTSKNPSHLYSKSGIYKIKLIVSDTGSCNYYDTLIRELVVLSNSNDTLPDKYICQGDFTQIGISPAGNPNVSYSWLPTNDLNNPNIANPIASNSSTQMYYLYISDGFCVDTFRQVVNVIPVYLEVEPSDTACLGDTVFLQATSHYGWTNYVWSTNKNFSDTLNRPTSNAVGKDVLMGNNIYYIKMSNKYCSRYDSLIVFASQIVSDINQPPKFCSGDSIYLTATILSYQAGKTINYNWQPSSSIISGATTYHPLIKPSKPTKYTLTLTNEHGCKTKDSVFVDVFHINYTLDIKHIRCYGYKDGHIIINLDSNSLPCTFLWDNHAGIGNKAINLPAGHYRVIISDTNNCKYEVDTTLNQPTEINTFFFDTNTLVYCNDTCSGYASAGATGGIPPYTYWWITGDTTTSITNLCAGEYVFVVTDQNACEDTAKITILDSTIFNVSFLIQHISCYGECDGSIQLFAADGRPPYEYQWKNGYTKDTASNLCTGVYDILVKDTARCSRRVFPIVKTPDPLLFSEIELHQPSCYSFYNGKIIAHISGGTPPYRYYWDDVLGNDTLENLGEGTYKLKVIDANDCETDTLITLLQFDSLDVNYIVYKTPCVEVCYGEAIVEVSGGNPPYSFDWSNGDTTNHPKRLCYGNHTLTIIDSNGCQKILHIFVGDSSYFAQKVDAWTDSSVIYRSQSITLYATDLGSEFTYEWSPAENLSNPKSSKTKAGPKSTTTYTVTVTDKYGCIESDTVTIFVLDVICDEPYIFIPNAFTPNKDGNNDVLYVRGKLLTDVYLVIFDRWGEKIFETRDINKGWDGTYKGQDCSPGVYVFYLEATCLGELFYTHKGNVTLIR
ncbi:MAG: gliding motility-associated C-terminal domain-containing protein [Bacteroidales bacterium]|nr:gliding motility-associated C-terminal domain-containing protein [Bacteroidales bacterium]